MRSARRQNITAHEILRMGLSNYLESNERRAWEENLRRIRIRTTHTQNQKLYRIGKFFGETENGLLVA